MNKAETRKYARTVAARRWTAYCSEQVAWLDLFPLSGGKAPDPVRSAYAHLGAILQERVPDHTFEIVLNPEPYPHVAAMREDLVNTGRIKVSGVHLGCGFLGNDAAAIRFRVWHDMCHVRNHAPFTLRGEYFAACEGDRQLAAIGAPLGVRAVAFGEIMAQSAYFDTYKRFPVDRHGRQPHVRVTREAIQVLKKRVY